MRLQSQVLTEGDVDLVVVVSMVESMSCLYGGY